MKSSFSVTFTLSDTPSGGDNLLIKNTTDDKSSGGLIIRSEEGHRYSISGGGKYQIITMDNFGGYLELLQSGP